MKVRFQEQIDQIIWRVDGKVKKIIRPSNSSKKNVSFDYDAMGHRIAKHVMSATNALEKNADEEVSMKTQQQQALARKLPGSTYYILDAQGKNADEPVSMKNESLSGKTVSSNEMSVYERVVDNTAQSISYVQAEKHNLSRANCFGIFGSTRLGVLNAEVPLLGNQNVTYSQTTWVHTVGQRTYELQNHLGNVLSVISDKVIPHAVNETVDYYLADIRQSTDYSPFGVTLHGRNFTASGAEKFRYGYNGMEKDDEAKGNGNSYTTEFRQYDPRLGRWLSLDPMFESFPWQSPYVAFDNNPIVYNDPRGGVAENQAQNPGNRKRKIALKKSHALSVGNQSKANRLQKKLDRLNGTNKGMFKENPGGQSNHNGAVFDKGSSTEGEETLPSNSSVADPFSEPAPLNSIGFKAAIINSSGKVEIIDVGTPTPAEPLIPIWPLDNPYGQSGQVLVDDNGNIVDEGGAVLIPILPGMYKGDGLYKSGDTVNSTGEVTKEDRIERREHITRYNSSGKIESTGEYQSRNITEAVEKEVIKGK